MASADATVHLVNSVLLDIRHLLRCYNRTTFTTIPDRVRARRFIMDKLNLVKSLSSTIPVKPNKNREKDAFFLQIYMLEIDVSSMHHRDAYSTPLIKRNTDVPQEQLGLHGGGACRHGNVPRSDLFSAENTRLLIAHKCRIEGRERSVSGVHPLEWRRMRIRRKRHGVRRPRGAPRLPPQR